MVAPLARRVFSLAFIIILFRALADDTAPDSVEDLVAGVPGGHPSELEEVLMDLQQPEQPRGPSSGTKAKEAKDKSNAHVSSVNHPNKKLTQNSWLTSLLGKNKQKKSECQRLVEAGEIPQSIHSPLKAYGYPSFDTETKKLTVAAGLPLSKINDFPVPIKVGSLDYIIQGRAAKVLLFLYCYSQYNIVGSVLNPDGHWDKTPQSVHPVYLQVSNVGPDPHGSVKAILLRSGVQQILKRVNPMEVMFSTLQGALDASPTLWNGVRHVYGVTMREWGWLQQSSEVASLLGISQSEAESIVEDLQSPSTAHSGAKRIWHLLNQTRHQKRDSGWSDPKTVCFGKPITVTITMYPKPCHNNRATLALSSSTVSVKEAFEGFAELLVMLGGIDKLYKVPDSFVTSAK
ncbi:hypothetical protein cyc_08493 [Cyclospora cayetanensis]|uniref:Uncharacterized protein n=1 Tax=Cyclospora cayetanensis TaxID=88456 RepID=A0A1D3D2U2_9EIME|nr:hypothetical protein cyc_08493 [Cyclospora cayetanensis]